MPILHHPTGYWRQLRAEAARKYRTYRYLRYWFLPRPQAPFDCAFIVGHFKTGTTSTSAFLEQLGLRHLSKNERVMRFRARGDYSYLDRLSYRFNSFDDHPWNRLDVISHFMAQDRDFRFILTDRDGDEWFDSLVRFVAKIGREPPSETRRGEFIDTRFHAHNAEVERLAAESGHRLLRLDVTKDPLAAQKIVEFLGLSPDTIPPFPHLNRTL